MVKNLFKSKYHMWVFIILIVVVASLFMFPYLHLIQKKTVPKEVGKTPVKRENITKTAGEPIKMVIRIVADGEILHYSNETYWSKEDFSIILGSREEFSSNLINNYTNSLKNYGLKVINPDVEFNVEEMKIVFTCDIEGAMYAKKSYDFTWFLSKFPFDLYAFNQSSNRLTYIGSLNNVEVEIYLIFPFPLSHCHAHVWPSG